MAMTFDSNDPRMMMGRAAPRMLSPLIFESGQHGERAYDIFSYLLKQRIIFIGEPIDAWVSNVVAAQLVHLDNEDSSKPIEIYINSPGGIVTDMFAIYDAMQYIKTPVYTLCVGMAMSAAAVLLLSGAKGYRRALPHAEIMLHQPSGGFWGNSINFERHSDAITRNRKDINKLISRHTGKTEAAVEEELKFDRFMSAKDALAWGVIDRIQEKRTELSSVAR